MNDMRHTPRRPHPFRRRALAIALLLAGSLVAPLARSQAPAPATAIPDLPPTPLATAWIDQDLSVVQARSALAAAGHAGAAIALSPHEWTTRMQSHQRAYRDATPTSREWLAQVERPLRVNGKAGLDRTLGELEVSVARARFGEARHESARALADLWLDVIASGLHLSLAQEQVAFAQGNLEAVAKRQRAGDASSLELNVARADLGEAQRQASLAASQQARAQARLAGRFPGAQPPRAALSEPAAPSQPLAWWVERVLAEAEPLKAAEAMMRRARAAADRAGADRVADPTVGVFTASEASRNERIVGVSLSIPLAGDYRRERAQQALREADVARAEADRLRREITTEVTQAHADAVAGVDRWRLAERVAEAATANARLMQRAYALGEADLQALLLARRQSVEAARAALEARAEALRARHRLLVDAHLVWDLEKD